MNHLPVDKRIQILSMLVEGSSMRSIERVCGVSINTVARYLDLAGDACAEHHDQYVRGIKGKRDVQCDELWSFVYAKDKSLEWATPWNDAGTVWTWTALDAKSKLFISYLFSLHRDADTATALFHDLNDRLERRPRVTADSLKSYRKAARNVWGRKSELSQVRKGEDTDHSTAYVERSNLTIRMGVRRYTRSTNAFSKKAEFHMAAVHLMLTYYNFCRIHKTLKVTPAMEAGLCSDLRDYDWLLDLVESAAPVPKKPGPKKGTKYRPRKRKAV
ncbi:MAG: DDE-type integrase/transposase/recombinase [Rhodospirillaceae bacterium]|nr:DDE-type integrase/transposase/recombinase [Rhodospirillaceae bacterium]